MRKLTAVLVASTLAFGAANFAHAENSVAPQDTAKTGAPMTPHHKGLRGPQHEFNMLKELNLTNEQKEQVRDILKAQHEKMRTQMQEDSRAMHSLVISDSFDQAKAQAQLDKMADQRKAQRVSELETQNKIYNILTPEQKEQYNANFEKRLTERPDHKAKMGLKANDE